MLPGVKGSWAEGHRRQGVLDEVPVDPELHQPGGATGHLWSASTAAERLVRPAEELQRALVEHLGELPEAYWKLTTQMVEAVSKRWFEADHGIWEARRPPRADRS